MTSIHGDIADAVTSKAARAHTRAATIYGLILAGGASTRMQRDKAALLYQGSNQLDRAFALLSPLVERTFVSVRVDQIGDPTRAGRPLIVDSVPGGGPVVGIRSAFEAHANVAWLVIAVDLPFLSEMTLSALLTARDPTVFATAFRSAHDGLPEPLCAIWEPSASAALARYQASGGQCPRKFLVRHPSKLVDLMEITALDNVNTPDEYAHAHRLLEL